MKVLKTIVATAVIVFALTTVAMAGVQHFTKAQSAEASGKAPVRYTVTLTAQQLAHLISDQSGSRVTPAEQCTGTIRAVPTASTARRIRHATRLTPSTLIEVAAAARVPRAVTRAPTITSPATTR